jgi:hypothetical protein
MLDMLSVKRTIRKIFEIEPFREAISELILISYIKISYVFFYSYFSFPPLNNHPKSSK